MDPPAAVHPIITGSAPGNVPTAVFHHDQAFIGV
jgi:hypothetical protein